MRIGVVSDTHNNLPNVARIVELLREARVERVVHTGDVTQPKTLLALASVGVPILGVYGNNDEREALAELTGGLDLAGDVDTPAGGEVVVLGLEPVEGGLGELLCVCHASEASGEGRRIEGAGRFGVSLFETTCPPIETKPSGR